ncbi:MAG TPA: DUF4097 family beta strand repeat-containing protein [Flavisolibacter sp.]|nr:DUF4097 family beta strand repeat-containing protein [Flavisolibacter sp.]
MKKISLFLTGICFTLLLQAQDLSKQEPYQTKSLAGESIKNVEVQTSGGSISVWGGNASEARVEVFVTQNNNRGNSALSKEEIKKRLEEDYVLNVAVNNGKVTATAKPKERNMDWKRSLNISFKVFVTPGVSTELETSGGSISLKNLSGNQDFHTSGGSLTVDNMSGKVKGRTSGGSIHVVNSKDEIDLETSGGSIHAENCTGNLNLSTSGGSLTLTGLKGKTKANTSGGNIKGSNIEGALSASTSGGNVALTNLYCSLETSTSGGHIDVSIKKLGEYIKIGNSGGNVDIQLPQNAAVDLKLRGKIKTSNLNNFSGDKDDEELTGKLNGGGIPVTVRAGSGRVSLSFE